MVDTKQQKHRPLTTLELFVVLFIIAVLAFVVFTALNPNERMADARDAERIIEMHAVMTAIHQYTVDTGALPEGMIAGMPETQLGTCATGGSQFCKGAQESCLSIDASLQPYLESMPIDPLLSSRSQGFSGYSVSVSEDQVITVFACGAEKADLSVSR